MIKQNKENINNILIHYVNGRVWFLCPIVILNKTKEYIIFRICENVTVLRATDQEGNFAKMDAKNWVLRKMKWRDNNLTYLVPFNEYIGFGVLRDKNGIFKEYYLNYQTKMKTYNNIITMTDLEIDFVIKDFENKIYYWKDIDEFMRLSEMNIIPNNIIHKLSFNEKILFEKLSRYKSVLDNYSLIPSITPKIGK